MSKHTIVAIAFALSATIAQAQAPMNHGAMGAGHQMPVEHGSDSAMAGMHERMMAAARGNPTESFHRQMIEHHRGGVMMARQVLGQTRDRQTIALAKRIIRDQQAEIAEMQAWLRRNGKSPQ